MTRFKHLLQAADPLSHEPPQREAERDRIRRTVVAAASDASATPGAVSRRSAAVMAAAALMIVAGVFVGSRVWSPDGTTLQAAVRFEVRLAEDQAASGLQAAQVAKSSRVIYLHREVVVTNADIAGSRVVPGAAPSQFSISVQLNAAGAQKMREATTNHIGKPVAILLDGDVVMAPTVKSAIGAAAMITGDFTRAEADRIADGIAVVP
jgi:hypothetical protein